MSPLSPDRRRPTATMRMVTSRSFDPIDDPVALTDGADTAEAGELADERLALLFRRSGELVGALTDETSDALVGDRLDELERGLGPRDRETAIRAHTPRRFLASA